MKAKILILTLVLWQSYQAGTFLARRREMCSERRSPQTILAEPMLSDRSDSAPGSLAAEYINETLLRLLFLHTCPRYVTF